MIKKTITLDFKFGDMVSLKTDPDEFGRVVTGYMFRSGGSKMYELALGVETSWHTAVEINKYPEPPKVKGFQTGLKKPTK